MSLESRELEELKTKIGRDPTPTELQIVAAEWSEHCSYKSSKKHLKMLPMDGPLVMPKMIEMTQGMQRISIRLYKTTSYLLGKVRMKHGPIS